VVSSAVFYVLVFSLLAGLLILAGIVTMSRNRARLDSETPHRTDRTARRNRKAERAQSRAARRKRH
jgi:predicted lysophospholipase L1 biosynthesis ABC-type transport system permease subunit